MFYICSIQRKGRRLKRAYCYPFLQCPYLSDQSTNSYNNDLELQPDTQYQSETAHVMNQSAYISQIHLKYDANQERIF